MHDQCSGPVFCRLVGPGVRVQELARRHGICTSLIYRWRRAASRPGSECLRGQACAGSRDGGASGQTAHRSLPAGRRGQAAWVIEIELDSGIRVRVGGDVSLAALRRVVTALRGDRTSCGVRIWLVPGRPICGAGLMVSPPLVAQQLNQDPFSGQIFAFRGRQRPSDQTAVLGRPGLVLYAKRLERGHFVWPGQARVRCR